MRPRCSDEWNEDDEDENVVDLYDAITRIEWREDALSNLAEDFTYEEDEETDDDQAD